ncbi:MAG: glycoside hydrolase family 30 beta sandwich domain-containing protein, partial [Bdellovibrionota bacterium]
VIYNGEFWGLGQVSRFITTKSRRVEVTGDYDDLPATAFVNPDGTIAFVAHNNTDDLKKFRVVVGNKSFTYELPAKYAVSFVWPN